jgi:hypothetical protein
MDVNIKTYSAVRATAWVGVVLFGIFTYWIITQIVSACILMNWLFYQDAIGMTDEFNSQLASMHEVTRLTLLFTLLAGGITTLGLTGSIGMLYFKKWGLYIFQFATLIFAVCLLIGIGYFTYQTEVSSSEKATHFMGYSHEITRKMKVIHLLNYTLPALIAAWGCVRINILLFKQKYRSTFS